MNEEEEYGVHNLRRSPRNHRKRPHFTKTNTISPSPITVQQDNGILNIIEQNYNNPGSEPPRKRMKIDPDSSSKPINSFSLYVANFLFVSIVLNNLYDFHNKIKK